MRAEIAFEATPAIDAAASAGSSAVAVIGQPGSGKTTALAKRAVRLAQTAPVLAICSHASGVRAFRAALARHDEGDGIRVATAPEHCLGWLRSHYALAGVWPDVRSGGEAAARAIVREAATGLLDMSWFELQAADLDLNLPFLSRPDKFFDEAAGLIRQLRGARVTPEDFERSCAAGLTAFYGDEVEASLAKCMDPALSSRVGKRGREALRAGASVLQQQKRAERGLSVLLGRLYREYLHAARTAPALSDEDILDECVRWLAQDGASARAIAESYSNILVDDAEDAHAGVADLLIVLTAAGLPGVTLAGWPDAAIDGLQGRRSALGAMLATERIVLPPLAAPASIAVQRLENETQEVTSVSAAIGDLIAQGVAPSDIAVLTRSADAAAVYAQRFGLFGLPVDAPLDRFAEPHEIGDWLALAAIVDDPSDHEHLLRVLASPLLGLSDASIYALCEDPAAVTQLALDVGVGDERKRPESDRQGTALARNMMEATVDERLPEGPRDVVVRFRERLAQWRERYAGMPAATVLARLMHAGGFAARWEAAPVHRRGRLKRDALRTIEAFAADGASGARRSLAQLVRAFDEGSLAVRPAERNVDAIACDTISGAKGEHWPHVFVVGLAHERFPRIYVSRAMAFSRTYGLIVRENVAPGAAQTAKFAWYYARFDAKKLYLAEERRALAYGLSRGWRSASASGFGKPPRWAKDYDLLLALEASQAPGFTAAADSPPASGSSGA
ncbi:MAG: 3'-5' exonuclease [Casimicrobiaceae bacterium]